jgi:Holliday junction resolvase YEN1
MEKAILHRILRLLFLGIQLHFVFDGPKRPPKRGQVWRSTHDKSTDLLVKTLDALGISYHKACAEAEADCSAMQKRGIVDAVWTEDGDAFMFGCTTLIRFHYEKKQGKESKSNTHFRLYRAEDITKRLPGLDPQGFVLFAILNGGDYDKAGLKGFGTQNSLDAVKAGLGKSLCRTTESDLLAWGQELVKYLKDIGSKIVVPPNFPVWEHLRNYRDPLITQSLSSEWQQEKPVVEAGLQPFVQEFYNFQAEKWVEWIVPMLLIRTLMQTGPGQERSNDGYEVKIGKQNNSTTVKATFLLSAVTSLDMGNYAKNKDGSFFENDFRAACETLPWILLRGVPRVMDASAVKNSAKPSKVTKFKARKAVAAQSGESAAGTQTTSASTGKEHGRPRKDACKDDKILLNSTPKIKWARKSGELDPKSHLNSLNEPSAKRSKLFSQVKPPALKNSSKSAESFSTKSPTNPLKDLKPSVVSTPSLASRQQEVVDLISEDETEVSKPVARSKQPTPTKLRASQKEAFSLISDDETESPQLANKPNQPEVTPPPKRFIKWNYEEDFGDSD